MGAIGMQVISTVIILCHYYGSISGGQEGLIRFSNPSGTACIAYNMRAIYPMVPLHFIVATAALDLLHIDFTSIEKTMELNQPLRVANILVFQDHFTKHVMAYVNPDQMAKMVAKFPYQGYILIFGDPARLLSDWDANFMSSIIDEMCTLLGMKKLQTMPYHPQANGLVERSHQTIM